MGYGAAEEGRDVERSGRARRMPSCANFVSEQLRWNGIEATSDFEPRLWVTSDSINGRGKQGYFRPHASSTLGVYHIGRPSNSGERELRLL